MTEDNENKGSSHTKDIIDSVTGLAKAIPVYEDAVQPAAKELGKSLETVAKTVNVALAPVSGLVWGYEKIKEFVSTKVAEKLSRIPEENIVTPSPNVAGPALEALRYSGHDENLSELYANLLAASMDSETSAKAHPSFVEFIKNMTPDEARVLRLFANKSSHPTINVRVNDKGTRHGRDIEKHISTIGKEAGCENTGLTPSYLENLDRLGLLSISTSGYLASEGVYDVLEKDARVLSLKKSIDRLENKYFEIVRRYVEVTVLGKQFIEACVIEKVTK